MKENILKSQKKYFKKNIRQIMVRLNKSTDQDLIDYVDSLDNIQGEIKRLMRARVKNNIFTNKQMNLIKEAIDGYRMDLEYNIETIEDENSRWQDTIDNPNALEQVKIRLKRKINGNNAMKEKHNRKLDELNKLRDFIDNAYYQKG